MAHGENVRANNLYERSSGEAEGNQSTRKRRDGRQRVIWIELLFGGGEPLQDVWPVMFEPLLLGQDWTVRRIDLATGCQHARRRSSIGMTLPIPKARVA